MVKTSEAKQSPRFGDATGGAFIILRCSGSVLCCAWRRSRSTCCPTIYRGGPALNNRLAATSMDHLSIEHGRDLEAVPRWYRIGRLILSYGPHLRRNRLRQTQTPSTLARR